MIVQHLRLIDVGKLSPKSPASELRTDQIPVSFRPQGPRDPPSPAPPVPAKSIGRISQQRDRQVNLTRVEMPGYHKALSSVHTGGYVLGFVPEQVPRGLRNILPTPKVKTTHIPRSRARQDAGALVAHGKAMHFHGGGSMMINTSCSPLPVGENSNNARTATGPSSNVPARKPLRRSQSMENDVSWSSLSAEGDLKQKPCTPAPLRLKKSVSMDNNIGGIASHFPVPPSPGNSKNEACAKSSGVSSTVPLSIENTRMSASVRETTVPLLVLTCPTDSEGSRTASG